MADMEKLKQVLQEYTGDMDSLNRFTETAVAELGTDWAQHIYNDLNDLSPDEQSKLDHAFQYYAALTAWEEIQGYLTQSDPLDITVIQDRIPVLSHWLAFFGEPGETAVNQLREKIGVNTNTVPPPALGTEEIAPEAVLENREIEPATPTDADSSEPINIPLATSNEGVPTEPASIPAQNEAAPIQEEKRPEPIWAVEKVFKQIAMTQSVQAWIAARCIELGNIEVFAYPHYGFLVDLMQQTLNDIKSLLTSQELLVSIDASYPNGIRQLQNMQISLEKDLQIAYQNTDSEETPLTKETLNDSDIRRVLGRLDTSNQPEYLGPAPDGFEAVMDPYEEFDEQPIKEGYSQIENVVLSEEMKPAAVDMIKNNTEQEKSTSQTTQNSVKRNLSFSLGNKLNKPSGN